MSLIDKKRKAEQNGGSSSSAAASDEADTPKLLPADARCLLEPLSKEQLLGILKDAACRHVDVLDAARPPTHGDASARHLYVGGLGDETTTDVLRAAFSAYGDIQGANIIVDQSTRKSKGFGFVTFRHVDGARRALEEPTKLIDGRVTVTRISSAGAASALGASTVPSAVVLQRKIFVSGVPHDMPAERLLQHFLQYGEIEEGPKGYDKKTMKSIGFALFVYKTPEGANAAVAEKVNKIDGHILKCSYAKGDLPVTSSGHMDARFDLPPSPGRGAGFAVRPLIDANTTRRKLFICGLSWDTTSAGLRAAFSAYGDIQAASVILEKSTGKSKGFGFVTFRHIDGALLALKEPSKLIDGRMTVVKPSYSGTASGIGASTVPPTDVVQRKICVMGVRKDMPAERLLQYFLQYGEIEEGPIGYDKMKMESKGGYVLFLYKTLEGVNAVLADRVKKIDGHILICCRAKRDGLLMTSSGADTVPGYGAIPGSINRLDELSSFDDVGAGSHYSLSSNLPLSLGVRSSGVMDAMFDLPPSPGRGAGFSGGYSSSLQFAGIGRGGLGAGGIPVTSSGAGTDPSFGAIPGSSDRLGGLSSFGDVGAGSHYSLSSNSSLCLRSSGLMDARFDPPPLPGRGADFGGGYSSSSQFAGIGHGGLGAGGYDGIGYGGGAHYHLGSSGITSGGDYGYSSSALQGQHQQPPRSPSDYTIPPRGSMYQQALPPYY